jgi:hypothetical protein
MSPSRVSQGAAAERDPSKTAGTAPRAKPKAKGTAPKPGALLLFPGAGSAASHPSLRAIDAAVQPLPTTRADFPYR